MRRRSIRCSIALEKLDFDLLHRLRRLGGLPGHPDVDTPFIATNTGSLGMGISKAYGMARAQSLHRPRRPHRRDDRRRRAAGRADLGIAAAGRQREARRDHRHRRSQQAAVGLGGRRGQRSRSDRGQVPRVRLGSAARRRPRSCARSASALAHFATVTDRPKVFIADTIKGKGVSFMEGLACGDQTYHFHAGAPSLKDYLAATEELPSRVNERLRALGQPHGWRSIGGAAAGARRAVEAGTARARLRRRAAGRWRARGPRSSCSTPICCPTAASRRSRRSCRIGSSSAASPSSTWCRPPAAWRSTACCRSCTRSPAFCRRAPTSTSTTTRPSAGRSSTRPRSPASSPAAPAIRTSRCATSRRSASVPGLIAFEPCSEREARLAIRWAVEKNAASTYLRFVNVPLDLPYALPARYTLESAAASRFAPGRDVALVGYGPLLLTQCVARRRRARAAGVSAAVINLPWLNRIDDEWVRRELAGYPLIVTLDNHYVALGQGVMVAAALARTGVRRRRRVDRTDRRFPPAAATPKCSRITASTAPRSPGRSWRASVRRSTPS